MRKSYVYRVQWQGVDERWRTVMGSGGNRSFVQGYFYGLTDVTPRSRAYRFVRWPVEKDGPGPIEVLEEKGICRGVQVNSGQAS